MAEEEEYYTPPQAARILSPSRRRVTQRLSDGHLLQGEQLKRAALLERRLERLTDSLSRLFDRFERLEDRMHELEKERNR